jgi:signal transduction histidine kinase
MSEISEHTNKDDDKVLFATEEASSKPKTDDCWNVLIVDDEKDLHNVTKMALNDFIFNGKRLHFISAYSGRQAREILSSNPNIAVILLDIVMENEDEGLQIARYIRDTLKDKFVRIVLRTGQPGHSPEKDVILNYDINEYKEKNELTAQKLFTSMVSSLRSYEDIRRLDSLNCNLEGMVKARTEELENINKELQDFAYIVSHDLKAPLRAIDSLANWILADYADKFDNDGKEQMNMLLSRVKRMRDLIDGVLQYSRVGRVREEKVNMNLNLVIKDVIEMLAAPENIKIEIESTFPTIKFEPTRIAQVFQNLIGNAVKYMDKPQGKITLTNTIEDGYCKFGVSDNGPGIPEKDFERVFQIFQTLTARDKFESTGVGLSLVKKIVEMYEGTTWVESTVGTGSTFFIKLPESLVARPLR